MGRTGTMRGSRNFCHGGPGPTARKQFGQRFFSPQLILQSTEGIQWFYYRGGPTLPRGGGPTSTMGGGRGVQMLISMETHITCDFLGGGGGGPDPLSPPLDPHMGSPNAESWSIKI